MLEQLKDKLAFKKRNRRSWERNTEFWLHSPLRHFVDTEEFLRRQLPDLFEDVKTPNPVVVDMGTGSGWALSLLRDLGIHCHFIGLDFNPLFIDHLTSEFSDDKDAEFLQFDLEETLPENLKGVADVVFNFFNFFEIANIESAFKNASLMLKPGGKLVMMTIDSYYLMFALVESLEELKELMTVYQDRKIEGRVPFFFQKIDLGDKESEEYEYASVLYSFADYFKQSQINEMTLCDYEEIVKTAKFIPKVYQYFVFENMKL
ncbi:MAG: class I SAM-dependent methyltransferase [Chloracidobacterium sp.]|nr:class I SAM-dependent methyltransferase [Chloracidobacterium sp.]